MLQRSWAARQAPADVLLNTPASGDNATNARSNWLRVLHLLGALDSAGRSGSPGQIMFCASVVGRCTATWLSCAQMARSSAACLLISITRLHDNAFCHNYVHLAQVS